MNRRVAVRGIFVRERKLLCVRLKPYSEFINTDEWCTIGGTVDAGETLLTALQREIIEETGIKPRIENLLYIQQYMQINVESLEFFFNIKNVNDYLNVDLAKTTHGAIEIAEIDYINPKLLTIQPKFLNEIDFTNFDSNTPTQCFSYL